VELSTDERVPKTNQDWLGLIMGAIQKRWVRLVSFPVVSMDGQLIHQECPLRLMFEEGGEWQTAGRFWPVAERLRLTADLDLAAVGLGLTALESDNSLGGLAINLSAKSLAQNTFRQELLALLKQSKASSRLWLEVSEAGAFDHFESFAAMCELLRGVGCKIGIEHFGRRFSEIGLLHDLGLDYIKVDGSFVKGLSGNAGNQTFLKGVSSIAHSIGLQVIAEGVESAEDLQSLRAVGFDGATGPAVSVAGSGN
jgi:EAL domain-containing protein (putative c-di-GMP-specific phosphodiesterase class I)